MSLRFSSNSETEASELLENIEDMFALLHVLRSSILNNNNSYLYSAFL